MGALDLFRKKPNEHLQAVADVIAANSQKDRTQVEHDKQIGFKKDVVRDEKLYTMLDALCGEYESIPIYEESKDGTEPKQKLVGYQTVLTGIKQDFLALRAFASQNNSLRFFSSKDARLFNIQTEAALLILETQQKVEDSGVEQSVFFSAMAQLSKANNIDSIEGRKLRAVLIDVTRTEVGVGEIQKQKNRLSI